MTSTDADVIVAGGGPAGAATASLLARQGWDVLLFEKAAFPREKPCAEFFSPGVADVLERLGVLGVMYAAGAARPTGMTVSSGSRSFTLSYDGLGEDGRQGRTALGLPRPLFDSLLLAHARANGARVTERVRVQGALLEDGRVIGVWARGAAGERTFRARFVVAADGLHSAVARSLGLEQRMPWPRRLGLVARYAGRMRTAPHGEMHVGRGVYCGIAPVGEGLINVGLVTGLGSKKEGERPEALFERRLAELPGALQALEGARRVTPVRGVGPLARRVRRVAGPGYLLVGDAAGFLDPFTGEGVYRALRGAELAAQAVDEALRRGDAAPLGYARARRTAFADKERVCLLVQLFLTSRSAFDYVLGHLAERPQAGSVFSSVLGDYYSARSALQPSYLWRLLRP